jgi:ABC-type transport system involved in multi-copper enzyme maturation permease subunit
MIGAVFLLEWMRAGRRLRTHLLRWTVGLWLVLWLLYSYSIYRDNGPEKGGVLAAFAISFLDWILVQQFIVVALLAPALVAGAITEEKTRHTLEHVLTTQINPLALIVGKLLARMGDVVVLTLVVLPMAAFVGPYAGATVPFLLGQMAVTILTAFGLSCLSVLASVWARSTRTAMVVVYLIVLTAGLMYWSKWVALPTWTQAFDPIAVLTPARDGSSALEFLRRLGQSAFVWLIFGTICVTVAAWRLRPAYIRQLAAKRTRYGTLRRWTRPAPSWNPLVWKERYLGRRLPRWLMLAIVGGITIWTGVHYLKAPIPVTGVKVTPLEMIIEHGWFAIGLLTLMVGVQASGAISGEREQVTWDGLLASPMTFREILNGKLRGIMGAAWPYLITYLLASAAVAAWAEHESTPFLISFGAVTIALALLAGWLAPKFGRWIQIALVLAWGLMGNLPVMLALAVTTVIAWLAMEFFASIGIWCSVRCTSSWRSLLLTIVLGYVGGTVLSCVSTPVALATALILYLATGLVEHLFSFMGDTVIQFGGPGEIPYELTALFFAIGVVLMYWWAARALIFAAENYLALTERVPIGRARLFDVEQRHRERAASLAALEAQRALDLAQ